MKKLYDHSRNQRRGREGHTNTEKERGCSRHLLLGFLVCCYCDDAVNQGGGGESR